VAGAVGKTIMAPIDRVKILYQVDSNRVFTVRKGLKTAEVIFRNAGVRGLWKGNGAAMWRVMPYSGLVFASFDRYEATLRSAMPDGSRIAPRFGAGAAAGATATLLTYPLDLLRARMAMWSTEPQTGGTAAALREIIAKEGPRALWNGLGPTLVGIVPCECCACARAL
jgi:solute carrier family 25 protein 42